MKKILSTAFIAILLSTSIVDTINAVPQRRTVRKQGQAPRRVVRRRNLPEAKGKSSPRQVTQAAKQAERDAKKLQADAQKAKASPAAVSEQTIVADVKKAEVSINKIEQQLANLRSWAGDVAPTLLGGGYSGAEKQKAFDIAAPYIKEAAILKARIASNKDKITQITTKTWFGYGTPTVKPGKEQEYAEYNKLITADEKRLAVLNPIITQQKIIMGEQLSNALTAAYGTMAAIALTVTGLQIGAWAGNAFSATALTQISTAASNVAYYASTPFSWGAAQLKAGYNWVTGNAPTLTQEQLKDILTTNLDTEANKQSWISQFGPQIADMAWDVGAAIAKAGGAIALEESAKIAYVQAAQALGNTKTTPADAEKAVRRLKDIIDKTTREREKAEKEKKEKEKYSQSYRK